MRTGPMPPLALRLPRSTLLAQLKFARRVRLTIDAWSWPISDIETSRLNLGAAANIATQQCMFSDCSRHANALAKVNRLPKCVPRRFPLLAPPKRRHDFPLMNSRPLAMTMCCAQPSRAAWQRIQRSPYPVCLYHVKGMSCLIDCLRMREPEGLWGGRLQVGRARSRTETRHQERPTRALLVSCLSSGSSGLGRL